MKRQLDMSVASKHQILLETLRGEIFARKFDGRDRFPSEAQLMRRFGVSRITVTRVLLDLKNEGLIESRKGYGSYLTEFARRRAGSLAMIMPGYVTTEIFAPLCNAIISTCRAAGYTVLFSNSASNLLGLAEEFAAKHVAGVFLQPVDLVERAEEETRKILGVFDSRRIPVVLLDRDVESCVPSSDYDLVGIDNFSAGQTLARHLIARGARNIRFFHRPYPASTAAMRIHGVRAAVLDAGLRWTAASDCIGDPESMEDVGKMFRGRDPADAVIAANDLVAAKLLRTLRRLRRRVPEDVLLAGFDDVMIAPLLSPPLTTMRQPLEQIADAAVKALLSRFENPSVPPRKVAFVSKLIVRQSSGQVPSGESLHCQRSGKRVKSKSRGDRPSQEIR